MTLAAGSDAAANRLEVGYSLTWYPDAHEAFVVRRGGHRSTGSPVLDNRTQLDDDSEGELGRDPRSLRRSRGQVRRYCTANRCNVLISSTYADDHLERATNRELVELDVRNQVRRLRWALGERIPYVSMAEAQPDRSDRMGETIYNGMLLVPRVPRAVFDRIIEAWPYGKGDGYNGVDVTQWRDKRGGAGYASKALSRYAAKDLGEVAPGRQAYRVGQGFQPIRHEGLIRTGVSGAAVSALEVWADHHGFGLTKLRAVSDDSGEPLDAAWGQW